MTERTFSTEPHDNQGSVTFSRRVGALETPNSESFRERESVREQVAAP